MSVGSSVVAPVASAVINGVGNAVSALGSRYFRLLPRRLVDRALPKPGTGPSEAVRERGFYKAETYTTTTSGARYVATMAQRGDPGYKATAVLLGESGLALALDRDCALRPARRADAGGGDGRRATGAIPGRGSLAGDRAVDAPLTPRPASDLL